MRTLLWAALAAAGLASPALAAPDVVVTIKPLHSLVAAVMDGVADPELIVKGGASPHTYSLKPSDARALGNADIVFWSGRGMEIFLEDSITTLAPNAAIHTLSETPGLAMLPIREGGVFAAHDHEEDGDHDHGDHVHDHDHDHDHGQTDMHFWLDPANAEALVGRIARTLADADPANADAYAANAATAIAGLAALTAELDAALAPVRERPFVVFHDAYQYFERRFGLTLAGSITVSPDAMPGAQRVAELRAHVAGLGAACIFAEPQFEPAIVATIAEGTGARTATLDPEGASLAEGPGLYAELLRTLARSLVDCLGD